MRALGAGHLGVGAGRTGRACASVFVSTTRSPRGLSALPGVSAVGGVNAFPLTGGNRSNGTFLIMSRPDEQLDMSQLPTLMKDPTRSGDAEFRVAGPGYFKAMNIPVVRGRVFEDRDGPDAPHVAVISASLAKTKWPNEDPIGKIIQYGNMDGDLRPFTVVGIVGDVREASLADQPRPTFYANYRQRPSAGRHVLLRRERQCAAGVDHSGRASHRERAAARRPTAVPHDANGGVAVRGRPAVRAAARRRLRCARRCCWRRSACTA